LIDDAVKTEGAYGAKSGEPCANRIKMSPIPCSFLAVVASTTQRVLSKVR
jgi:hypothetical protein